MSARLDRLTDRLNPMLVKEVRQALKGRLFIVGYLLSLIAAFCVVMGMLMSDARPDGAEISVAMFTCLAVAIFTFVPLSAFMSMGGEWDENTHDLLVLSNLTPRRIVWGKLLSAFVQALIAYSAFLPFFVFAFLLRGVNLPSLLLVLGGALAAAPAAAMVAIGLSSLTTNRFLRILLLVVLVGGSLVLVGGGTALSGYFLGSGIFSAGVAEQAAMVGVIATVAILLIVLGGEMACTRLAHPEENRSTGLRVALFATVVAGIAWCRYAVSQGADLEFVSGMWIFAEFALVIPVASFASEPAPLGRRVAQEVPRSRLLAWLVAPFLPGGGRGILYWIVLQGVLAAGASWVAAAAGGSAWSLLQFVTPFASRSAWESEGLQSALFAVAFSSVYLLLPSLLVRSRNTPARRVWARVLVPLTFLLLLIVPAALEFFSGGRMNDAWDHGFNPGAVLDDAWDGTGASGVARSILPAALLALLALHFMRLLDGITEVLDASRRRRRGEAKGDAAAAR